MIEERKRMLCELCALVGRLRVTEAESASKRVSGESFAITCDGCGKSIGSISDRVGQTLAQLARFGLTGQKLLAKRRAS
jgi:hypothetical protein